ncbi:CDP-glycerol glycerophosphotransferase family protein [Ruminococcus sp. OA3]|uniref:CDP-glycerol glycerophosphotransferase family protein n=1 Tax=Ruminococcus sp. OA3 TaxID=2914164 RepID=UPI001F0555CD|nr:CDP-glycerol glycerophosphotransferase family protein [Ruminococcus sp. OA3]MCH1982168.1 CDP-glycerol glycerophosphotransferase family protein [Ruminococcus sp. OA3]
MKRKLMSLIKYCRPVYALYYYLGTWFLNFLKLFVRTDDRLILFNSFGGKSFNDSPRAIYEAMRRDPRFSDFRFVWAFQDPEKFSLDNGEKIRADTFSYFLTALKARVWITNSSLERGLGFVGKHTFFVNTWHGTPLKKMGNDLKEQNTSFKSRNSWNMDLFTTQSVYEAEIFTRVFELKPGICQVTGLPRNDELAQASDDRRRMCREKLGIAPGQCAVLYAPTFREYEKNDALQCVFAPPIQWEKWPETLGYETVILVRAHYETVRSMKLPDDKKCIRDVSDYESLNELMIASDILVSDYSSVFFDYSILEKPMVCFAYDYDQYEAARGMYFDIREWMPGGSITEEELLRLLNSLKEPCAYEAAVQQTVRFRKEFVKSCGHGVENVLNVIAKKINLSNK